MNVSMWSQHHLDRLGVVETLVVGERTWTNAGLHLDATRLAAARVTLGGLDRLLR